VSDVTDPRPTQAAVYLRISSDPTGQAAGVTRQREDCLQLVEQQGWTLHEVYTDNDTSAYKARPAYTRMLDDIRAGHIDAVVAWHPDRLYRRLKDLEGLIEAIESRNVILRTCRAGELDLSTPTGRMLARILGSVAMAEGEVKADRWKRSWRQGREAGKLTRTGSRMFGYDQDGNVIDHEAAIARVMAAKIREGGSILGVCRWLDEQGVRATRGSAWTPQSVKRYLTNPRLAGYSTLNGEIVADGSWEPILDRETWETVRAMLTARTRAHVPRKALLLDLIYCGKCGHRLITSSGRKGARNYRCPKRPGMDGCGSVSGIAAHIEDYVEGYAERRLSDPKVRQRIAELSAHPAEHLVEINALDQRVRELETQLEEPGVPVDALLRGIQRAKDRRAELAEKLAARGSAPLPPVDAPWPEDLMRRRALVDLVVERIDLQPADMTKPRGFDKDRVQISPR
jgi:DNA invertase Pin-like site-specific DNA recombinase